jgi:hypothetical protein
VFKKGEIKALAKKTFLLIRNNRKLLSKDVVGILLRR